MKGLVIAGGQSTRMRREKATLVFQGCPLHARIADALKCVTGSVFVSARPDSSFLNDLKDPVLFDDDQNMGPAAALLRAHREFPLDDWFVIACDFPNVSFEAVEFLANRHLRNECIDLSCYAHADGTPEPLFSIWTPIALARLKNNVKCGFLGPMHTLRECEAQLLRPRDRRLLFNTNTPHEWEQALL